jgi:hypothetical protein
VDPLHGGNDPEFSEAGNVGGVDVLGMFDAPAQVLRLGVRFERCLEDIESFPVGAVPDGMDAELKSVPDADLSGSSDFGGIVRIQAGRIRRACGQVGIRLE